MITFFIFPLIFGAIVLIYGVVSLLRFKHYNVLMTGTIVGKYRTVSKRGYVVVQVNYQIKDAYVTSLVKEATKTQTFRVPTSYYNSCKIGDTGIFPFKITDEINQY